jgi:2-hydroxychromene-2-carboxylate isomerase
MAELLRRRVIPSAVIALSALDAPARAAARVQRALGRRGRVELYFAFDDPCSAVAMIDLAERLAGRPLDVVALPVVRRGIPGDPAVDQKRRYAIEDARRIARRRGLELARTAPIDPARTAGIAAQAMTLPEGERLAYCLRALEALWIGGADLAASVEADDAPVRRNERRMRRRGPYDTPAAVIGRDWWFAHDRLAQIAERLDRLGWTRA